MQKLSQRLMIADAMLIYLKGSCINCKSATTYFICTTNKQSSNNHVHSSSKPYLVPQLLSIPLTRRPLFPGYYKSMYIKDPKVIAVIQELVKSGSPYVGIFMAKDENADDDMVTRIDQVEKVACLQ